MSTPKILIIGANGQIGTELAIELARLHGEDAVITSDLSPQGRVRTLQHEALDVTDAAALAAAWPHLDSPDRFIRYAARLALLRPQRCWVRHSPMRQTPP